jgi:DNA-binding MarR family transcriptional regulator
MASQRTAAHGSWSFLTNYALILVYVVLHPESPVRSIANGVGITERATLSLLRDLDDEGIVDRQRSGRRNTYSVNFTRLSSMRRGGSSSALTPRAFVDVIIQTLFESAQEHPERDEPPRAPRPVHADDLEPRIGTWGFFTNQMLLLLAIAGDGAQTVRELSAAAEITERAAVALINQLETATIIVRHREGRRNRYTIDLEAFRRFRGWEFDTWAIPPRLVSMATDAIGALAGR